MGSLIAGEYLSQQIEKQTKQVAKAKSAPFSQAPGPQKNRARSRSKIPSCKKKEPPNALKYEFKALSMGPRYWEKAFYRKKLSLKVKPPSPPLVEKAPPLISKAPALPQGDAQLEKDTVKPKKPGEGLQSAPVPSIAVLPLQSAPNISKPKSVKKKTIPDRSKPKPVKKKRRRRPSTNMRSALTKRLGPHKTNALLFIIDSRIKVYGMQTRNDVTDFLVRSYQRYYRKEKAKP